MNKVILISCLLSLVCIGARADNEWLPNFEDVPMMEKTYTVDDAGFVYSQPSGKIVHAMVASDDVTRRELQRFYRDALRELGWDNQTDERKLQIFTRTDEELKIEITDTDPLRAEFTLTPLDDK